MTKSYTILVHVNVSEMFFTETSIISQITFKVKKKTKEGTL